MMKMFIAATPIFDYQMGVMAYRLCDRNGDSVLNQAAGHARMKDALTSPGLNMVARVGLAPFAAEKPLFAEINRLQLLMGMPTNTPIEPSQLVVLLPSDLPIDDEIMLRCESLSRRGHQLALDGFPSEGLKSALLLLMDYILVDYKEPKFKEQYQAMQQMLPGIRLVVTGIPDMEAFHSFAANKEAWFSGSFYNQPITAGVSDISPVKVNALQLMNEVNGEDFELEDISSIVERDPFLTISLLKYINSSPGRSRNVESIRQAVAILGQEQVRRWATVAIQLSLAEDQPGEITRLSLVRAKFAENLAGYFELGIFQQGLFMMGLFSLLDVILQKPMDMAIKEVAVNERVRQALVEKEGPFYPVLELMFAYEHADWDKVSFLMIRSGLKVEDVSHAFIESLVWYQQLLSIISIEAEDMPAEQAPDA